MKYSRMMVQLISLVLALISTTVNSLGTRNCQTMSGSNIYSALKPLYLATKLVGLAPYPAGKTGTAIPDVTTKSRFGFCTLHNYIAFLYLLAWFIFNVTWEGIYRYPKLSNRSIIPIVIRTCSFASMCLSSLILCHRGTHEEFCTKIALVDQILLGKKASLSYMKTKLIVVIEILLMVVMSCFMILFDMNGRNVSFISTVKLSGWIVGGVIGTITIIQFVIYVLILKNRFRKLNRQLSAMVVRGFEKETLETLLPILDQPNKIGFAGEVNVVHGSKNLHKNDPLFLSVSNIRNQVLQYNNNHIRALRLSHGILCDTVKIVNSDYGFQILSELSYAFVSFVMFSFVAMDAKNDPTVADCEIGSSCVRVITDLCISCLCILKVVTIAASCHAVTSEISDTSIIVQKLVSPRYISGDTLSELQLFSQQLWNTDSRFTAFGFFELNLNLLCSMAGTATTYIVVLLQLK
ncbi:uncharacterized protein LOC110832180 isoform X1 [Zootermopsis nevadensis]|uniref:uncharacterized protein LOC110832180 isoform X1 n=1 Tax=Zootermopsis nevadensis TaxID=136037 RepID=UPI000B8E5FDA|nr:uncharacterized protein LOC110832180 isoform X1 [Zootermopsis nevadensis]